MQKLVYLFIFALPIALFSQTETAEAKKKVTCRSIGLTWSSAQKRCVGSTKKQPRYKGRGNKYCRATQPGRQNMAGFRMANSRAPFMKPQVYGYLKSLKAQCRNLRVESTFRSCDANRSARGMQKSNHLCGAAADISGCDGITTKEKAAAICRQNDMIFINEGPKRFPHCQMNTQCN